MAREKIFRFKQFSVVNDKTAMKVGTDGVLLGAWCDVNDATRVLDVGTGCGVIAMMIAQRQPLARVYAIDIDGPSVDEASFNFSQSPWRNRLEAVVADFNCFGSLEKFDLIVSNPPFFTNGILPPDDQRNQARHTTTLNFSQLIGNASRMLTPAGILALITPADVEDEIRRLAVENGLWVRRFTSVIPVEGAAPKRILWELSHSEAPCQSGTLVIADSNHNYTHDYIALTRDFYLKM